MENISQFGKGAIRDKYDPRDYQIKKLDTFGASVIPDEFSFRDSFDQTPIKNQDGSLSCGGQAFSKYFEGLSFNRDGVAIILSAKDIYQPVCVPGWGSKARDLIQRVLSEGIALESDISSYENGKAPSEQFMETSQPRTPEQDDRAHEHQGLKYFTFDSTDPEQVKEAIWQGKGCILALEGNNPCWTTQDGIVEIPETTTWGHFLVLTGRKKINRSYYWEACNSWGLVGDNGYYYIPEEYLNKGLGYNEWTFIEAPAQEYSMLQQIIILLSKIIGLIKK